MRNKKIIIKCILFNTKSYMYIHQSLFISSFSTSYWSYAGVSGCYTRGVSGCYTRGVSGCYTRVLQVIFSISYFHAPITSNSSGSN